MTKKTRAVTATAGLLAAFIGTFAALGYHLGFEATDGTEMTGWPAALAVGGIAAATVVGFAILLRVIVALAEWIDRGSES
jgi:hypothetical protein